MSEKPGNLPHGTFVLVLRHAAVVYQAPLVLILAASGGFLWNRNLIPPRQQVLVYLVEKHCQKEPEGIVVLLMMEALT